MSNEVWDFEQENQIGDKLRKENIDVTASYIGNFQESKVPRPSNKDQSIITNSIFSAFVARSTYQPWDKNIVLDTNTYDLADQAIAKPYKVWHRWIFTAIIVILYYILAFCFLLTYFTNIFYFQVSTISDRLIKTLHENDALRDEVKDLKAMVDKDVALRHFAKKVQETEVAVNALGKKKNWTWF